MSACALTKEPSSNYGITVKQFGAVGDGKTDDTAAIQKALNFAAEKNIGNPVIFPSGGYVISKPLTLPVNVDLIGGGIGFFASIIPVDCDGIWIKGETQKGGYAFRNKIQSLNINMLRATKGTAIIIDKAYNIKLADVFIYSAPDIGIDLKNSRHITFDNVIVYGALVNKGIGIKVSDSIVNMYNIDIESVSVALEIGPDKLNNTNVSVFGGYIERIGKFGVNIINSAHNTFIGLNVETDSSEKIPVNINGLPMNQSLEKSNTFIGGYIGYEKHVDKGKSKAKEFELNKISNAINVGD